jgi:hypothetical protein
LTERLVQSRAKLSINNFGVGHISIMASEPEMLTREEFAILRRVGNTPTMTAPPAGIPTEHCTRLIALDYVVHLLGDCA